MDSTTATVHDEDMLRAQCYALLARFLASPPTAETLALARALRGDGSELGRALDALAVVAAKTTPNAAEIEYHDLFIGVAQGELQPYASYYLTGFLHEKPLADLRGEMAVLGIVRRVGVHEPEDHIAALCEMMAGLISGAFDAPADLDAQRKFFEWHIAPWAPRFFADLESAKAAVLYMPIGTIGRLFMRIENEAFAMTG
jgi:TorA maturation chaperone TorD